MPNEYVRALPLAEIPPGTKQPIEISGKSLLICNSNDQLYAISNICSHAQQKLECGRMQKGWIACPAHGARFELATGRAINPPAVRPIATYEVRVVEGWVEVLVE